MTDLGITTTTRYTEDRSWLRDALNHVQQTYTLDPSTGFVEAQHYPNGHIPSGVAVAYDTATDRLIPWDAAGAGDEVILLGVLYNSVRVTEAIAGSRDLGVPVMVQGFVSLANLPTAGTMTNGGFGATLATARTNAAIGNANQLWLGA